MASPPQSRPSLSVLLISMSRWLNDQIPFFAHRCLKRRGLSITVTHSNHFSWVQRSQQEMAIVRAISPGPCTARPVSNYFLKHLWPASDRYQGGGKPAAPTACQAASRQPPMLPGPAPWQTLSQPILPTLTFWKHIKTGMNHRAHLKTCQFATVTTCGPNASVEPRSSWPSPHSRSREQTQRQWSHFPCQQLINKTF